ncbi:fumarylacetoacetase [Piscinibacter sp.]|uniref:fumarylacetoacetase n=1 Tax=Piscinibacter sp. TaxID=1903157 RepID=UPI002C589EB0|nr:fumarylacetoacetase [Albitalea sp.]HUG23474.1 fumarylacetoacetase [Albitalea sp.]
MLNETHDPSLSSWVDSANAAGTDFPVQNLPHAVFRRRGTGEAFRGGVAIGDEVLDMAAAQGVFEGAAAEAAARSGDATLNGLMALGPAAWSPLRHALSRALRRGASQAPRLRECIVPQAEVEYAVPADIGDFTDFFSSFHHMVNAGRVFQPDAPPLPNFRWLPIAYHGRASTIEVSGASFHRPHGQRRSPGDAAPSFGPTRCLDYEMELAAYVGPGNRRGEPIGIADAEQHLFGLCLLNDWSARDVQGWEAMPLGPFLAKNFLSTVSPWIVTLEALAPFRCALPRSADDPPTLPYLRAGAAQADAGFDVHIEVWLQTPRAGSEARRLSRSSPRHAYWSLAQMVTHHTVNGCTLRPGDLLGTGTQSGPGEGEQGCLLELTRGGRQPLHWPDGEQRTYLEDGDTVVLRGWCEHPGHARIGFGECRGSVLPARPGA